MTLPSPSDPRPFLPLFVPADRPERYAKAARSGADAVIVDLEDAVAPDRKGMAREALVEGLRGEPLAVPVIVRVNAAGTSFHEADVAALGALAIAGVMLPKSEDAATLRSLRGRLPGCAIHALVESPRGLADARAIAAEADRVAFGSIDFAVSLGMAHRREALLAARCELVLACALAGRPAPIDGVTRAISDGEDTREDAEHAAMLGFGGKLLIHPAQIAPALAGFAPEREETEAARRILAASEGEAARVDGAMVDRPVVDGARALLARADGIGRRFAALGEVAA